MSTIRKRPEPGVPDPERKAPGPGLPAPFHTSEHNRFMGKPHLSDFERFGVNTQQVLRGGSVEEALEHNVPGGKGAVAARRGFNRGVPADHHYRPQPGFPEEKPDGSNGA